MANLRGRKARNAGSGAFALGFSDKMKSVAGAAAVLMLATTGTVVVQAQVALPAAVAQTSTAGQNGAPINIDAFESGVITNANQLSDAQTVAKNVISGRYNQTVKQPNAQLTGTYDGFPAAPQQTVYLQWIDTDGSVSPVYSTKTHNNVPGIAGTGGDGLYAFDLPAWTDASGEAHHFQTKSSQRYRIWTEPSQDFTSPAGNPLTVMRTAPGLQGGVYSTGSGQGMGEFPGSVGVESNVQRTAVWTYELPGDYIKAPQVEEDKAGPLNLPASDSAGDGHYPISGNVWEETRNFNANTVQGPFDTGENPASGYTVYTSILKKEYIQEYDNTVLNQPALQHSKLTKEFIEAKRAEGQDPVYTISAPVAADGRYTQRVPKEFWDPRHMYTWVEDPQGNPVTVHTNDANVRFGYVNEMSQFQSGVTSAPEPFFARIYNRNFGVMFDYIANLDIVTHNTTDAPAKVGDQVTAKVTGTLSPLVNKVVWYREDGSVLTYTNDKGETVTASCEITSVTDLGNCGTITVPKDAKEGEIIQARLYGGDHIIAADSFIVKATPDTKPSAPQEYPKDSEVEQGGTVTIKPTTPVPAGQTPKLEDPNGNPVDELTLDPNNTPDNPDDDIKVTIDPDGTITVKPGPDAPIGNVDVPVVNVDDSGNKVPDSAQTVPVKVTEKPATPGPDLVDYRPSYGDAVIVPAGDSRTADISYPDGQTPPAGTRYELDPNYTVPAGWTVKVDESTGQVTATANKAGSDGADQEELVVPVKVIYPDGTSTGNDVANAVFKLDTDGDGNPDLTDTDDDGDGIPDAEEIDKGSDPKDPNSKPQTPVSDFQPSYPEATVPAGGKVTSDVTFKGDQKPEGTKFAIDPNFKVPAGWNVTVDSDTGAVTAEAAPAGPNGADQEQIIVPVIVTYPDGTATGDDLANAVFNLDTDGDGIPDTTDPDDDNDGFTDKEEIDKGTDPKDDKSHPVQADDMQPEYEDGSGKPGDEVKVPAPSFKDKDGNPTTAPEGTKFAPGANVPDGVTVDPNTGEVTVKVPADAKPGDKITVPVEVTYPDGSKDTVDVTVTVGQPDAPGDQPDWEDGSGKPGDVVTLPNGGGPVKDGTKVETEGPGKAIIDDKGNIKVDINDDAKPGDKITVVVKDPEGNDIDKVTVTVEDPKTPGEPGGDGSLPGGDNSGSLGSSDGLIPGLIGGGIIGGLIGGSLDNNGGHGSSTPGKPGAPAKPGKPGEAKPGKPGAGNAGADKGGNTGNNGAGNTGNAGDNGAANQGGNAGAGQSNTGDNAADQGNRGGQLAMTGVSGVAVTLGAAVLALAVGGALLALRRRRES